MCILIVPGSKFFSPSNQNSTWPVQITYVYVLQNEEHASSTVPVVEDDPNCFQGIRQSAGITSNAYSVSTLCGKILKNFQRQLEIYELKF